MGILDTLLSGQNAQLMTQLARNSGINEADVQKVICQLLVVTGSFRGHQNQ